VAEPRPVQAVLWNVVGRFLRQVVQLITSILLTRLLQPEDFGLVAMVTVFTGFAQNYVDLAWALHLFSGGICEQRTCTLDFG
jgi:O-antigen/teichoic acid export membrane protein